MESSPQIPQTKVGQKIIHEVTSLPQTTNQCKTRNRLLKEKLNSTVLLSLQKPADMAQEATQSSHQYPIAHKYEFYSIAILNSGQDPHHSKPMLDAVEFSNKIATNTFA